MDVGLRIIDEYALDRAWAWAAPATSSIAAAAAANASSAASSSGSLSSSSSPLLARLAAWGASTTAPALSSVSSYAYSYPLSEFPAQFASAFPRDSIFRQLMSLLLITTVGSNLLYFTTSTFSYYFLFDRRLEHHPRFIKNQVKKEIALSVKIQPIVAALIVPWFVAEIRGHTLMYDDVGKYRHFLGLDRLFPNVLASSGGVGGWAYLIFSIVPFMAFTDYFIYWIHRWLHLPFLYKRLHKPHHKWLVPTPFAALAFHPLDGYAQSVPYHLIPYLLPIHKSLYIVLFVLVNVWTILIHDGDMISGHFLEKWINSPAHHTLHHLYFTCNYGQYFTWADKAGGSYRAPRPDLDPLLDALKNMEKKKRQAAALAAAAESQQQGDSLKPQTIKKSTSSGRRRSVDDDGSDSGYGSEKDSIADALEAEKKVEDVTGEDQEIRRRR